MIADALSGELRQLLSRLWTRLAGSELYRGLRVTLVETLLAFGIGTLLGRIMGSWLSPIAAAIFDPHIARPWACSTSTT